MSSSSVLAADARTDNAYIVRSQAGRKGQPARKFKLNAQPGTCAIVKR